MTDNTKLFFCLGIRQTYSFVLLNKKFTKDQLILYKETLLLKRVKQLQLSSAAVRLLT